MRSQYLHRVGHVVWNATSLALVVVTSCIFQGRLAEDILLQCATNDDCPSGYGCDPNTELCVSAAELEPPANDSCDSKETLIPSESPQPVFGRTTGATHSMSGPIIEIDEGFYSCNGDAEVAADAALGPAPDVFYHLELDNPTNLDIFVDGTASSFSSSLYVMELPGPSCPADLTTLEPFMAYDAPLCESGIQIRARMSMAPAGHYLVVVDGHHVDDAFYGLLYNTQGFFDIWAQTYPGDFPPAAACVDATEVTVPEVGQSTSFAVDFEDAPIELRANCGGRGGERVFTLRPQRDVDVVIAAGGRDGNVDTVVYLLIGACNEDLARGTRSEDGLCNDDGKDIPNYGSLLTASLVAGTEYYLVIDTYSTEYGEAEVVISVAEPTESGGATRGNVP